MISWLRRIVVGDAPSVPQPAPQHVPAVPDLPTRLVRPTRLDAALEVVGEGYRQEALERISGGRTEDGALHVEQTAVLVPDPANPYDPNAVAVVVEGFHVGYLTRTEAESWQPVLAWAKARGFLVAAEAALIGGWDRGHGDRGSFGIVLHLGTASETLAGLMLETLQVRGDHPWQSLLIAFTGDSTFRVNGFPLDRNACTVFAQHAGMHVHPRVTKKVQLLVDCDASGVSGNQAKADEYGIRVIGEREFWAAIGLPVEEVAWHEVRRQRPDWTRRP
jgi:hypothetical protein